ncbi:hypothetical protein PICMEDRAFT_17299 [Pichia membranifaciens NRRL Y-2026]|uniref:TAP42-like protein n=1 Tax=Pichia membranifaciens NRRL Y-2026 TaxID=763406 RepID=A0A1E3NIV7_9ASCO|nr:hypothetical protein PICMEDRAFT_17299 [Pichia membranifaciens NRRL Y-2026]ODQ46069.1 hypothetical protein PICMEDRAFT_17299 [Pichia membranifaciens NRRL Y-2026]
MEQNSIASKYKTLNADLKNVQGRLTFEQFRKIHNEFIELSNLIEKADLFSENETLDEVSTSSLAYLLVSYKHGKFIDSNAVSSQLGVDAEPAKRNRLRLVTLQIVESMIWKFVSLVVLDLKIGDSLGEEDEKFKGIYKWITAYSDIRQREISSHGTKGFVKLNELELINFKGAGPMARRDMKIDKWNLEKALGQKVKLIGDTDDMVGKFDDEVVRKVRIDQLLLAVVESVSLLESNAMEREMLTNVQGSGDDLEQLNIEGMKLISPETEDKDSRKSQNKGSIFDKGYTDKLEFSDNDKKLLSKEGKVLRPFTIVSSDKQRKELQNKVFGTGQVLPSMTVEELVEQELQNGGMVKPKEEEPEIDEDDYEWQNKETRRLREWDDFTDSNKKGSGNKMGNIG